MIFRTVGIVAVLLKSTGYSLFTRFIPGLFLFLIKVKNSSANIAFLVLFTGVNSVCCSQQADTVEFNRYMEDMNVRYKRTDLVTGFNWQPSLKNDVSTIRYVEVGVGRSVHQYGRHGPVSVGAYVSEEIYFGKNNIYGTKAGVYMHYMFDLGFSAIYYTDFKKGNFKLRPEFGIGMMGFRAVIGFNIPTINNKAFYRLQKNYGQITIQYMWPLKKQKVKDEGSIFRNLFKKEKNGSS